MKAGGRWLAVVVVLACFLSLVCLADPSLSGDWSLDVTIDPSAVLALSITSSLNVTYSIGEWDFSSSSGLGTTGWTSQSFKAGGTLGDLTLGSTLTLDTAGPFKSWKSTASWDIDVLSFSGSFDVTPNYVALGVSTDIDVDPLSLGVDVELRSQGGCGLLFNSLDISFDFPFCCTDVSGGLEYSCDGFEELELSVSGIVIPSLPWMTIDADVVYEIDEKKVDLSPSFDLGAYTCLDLYVEIQTPSNLTIGSYNIYGIGLKCDIGDVRFEALSYIDGTHKLGGKYWEMYALSFNDDGCCGAFSGGVKIYFLAGGAMLFDVSLLESSFSLTLSEQVKFDMGISWDIEAGIFEELTLGFAVSW